MKTQEITFCNRMNSKTKNTCIHHLVKDVLSIWMALEIQNWFFPQENIKIENRSKWSNKELLKPNGFQEQLNTNTCGPANSPATERINDELRKKDGGKSEETLTEKEEERRGCGQEQVQKAAQ